MKEAKRNGVVQIRRRDGHVFALRPENSSKSPLDVKGVDLGLSREDIVSIVRSHRAQPDLNAAYREMALDEARETEALEWIEGTRC